MKTVQSLEKDLDISFIDKELLLRALTHTSYINENPSVLEDNERLEFLGDAVLDFMVGNYLYRHLPDANEGDLTEIRAALVKTDTLAKFAKQLSLGKVIRLGNGEIENGGRKRKPILCAAFEAVVGAIYLEHGLEAVDILLERFIPPTLEKILKYDLHKDNKSEFQVWAQAEFNVTPRYELIGEAGPEHNKLFTVQVQLGDEVWGQGTGRNKQIATQQAATMAMQTRKKYLLEKSE